MMVESTMARHSFLPCSQSCPPDRGVGCRGGLREPVLYSRSAPTSGRGDCAIERATGPRVCLIVPSIIQLLDARGYFLVRGKLLAGCRSRRSAGGKSPDSSNARVCRRSIHLWEAASGRLSSPSSVIGRE